MRTSHSLDLALLMRSVFGEWCLIAASVGVYCFGKAATTSALLLVGS